MQPSRLRRFAVAITSLLIAAAVFRSQVAQALVIRGDDFLYSGRYAVAERHYERALKIDPGLEDAADHLVFVLIERRTPAAITFAIKTADGFLDRDPANSQLLADRALCFLILHRYGQAARDFQNAAIHSSNSQAFVFAGWAARRAGKTRTAMNDWRRALQISPKASAARFAMALNRPQ